MTVQLTRIWRNNMKWKADVRVDDEDINGESLVEVWCQCMDGHGTKSPWVR